MDAHSNEVSYPIALNADLPCRFRGRSTFGPLRVAAFGAVRDAPPGSPGAREARCRCRPQVFCFPRDRRAPTIPIRKEREGADEPDRDPGTEGGGRPARPDRRVV